MDDLPLHEACVGFLRHWGDDRFTPRSLYVLNLGQSNQLFSLLLYGVSYIVPIDWASKLVVAAALLALPLAAAHFADYLEAPRSVALLVAPIGFGWLFFWGLIQNIIGLAALFALLPAIDRFARRPSVRGALAMSGAMVLLHFAHQAMQVVACAALVLCSVGPRWRSRDMFLRGAPVVFAVALEIVSNHFAWKLAGPRGLRTPPFTFTPLDWKLVSIPGVLFGGYEPYVRNLLFVLAMLPIILFCVDRRKAGWTERTTAEEVEDRSAPAWARAVHRWRFEALGFVLFCAYLAGPLTIKSTTFVYHRFLPPAWAILAVCAAAGTRAIERPSRIALCIAVPIGTVLAAWPAFADSDRVYRDLARLIQHIEPGSAVMTLNLGPNPPHRLWDPTVSNGYIIAERGGRGLFDYSQSPVSPVVMRPEKEWIEPLDRIQPRPYEFRPDYDFTRFRYLALITPRGYLASAIVLAVSSVATIIAREGDWYLFESKMPLVPVDEEYGTTPIPHPPSLHRKLQGLARQFHWDETPPPSRPAGAAP